MAPTGKTTANTKALRMPWACQGTGNMASELKAYSSLLVEVTLLYTCCKQRGKL